MKLSVLSENTAGKYCMAEHGLSFLIEADQSVLFDTGASGLFVSNAETMGIDLSLVDTVVLSHGHDDHSGGLEFLQGKMLVAHPDCLLARFRKSDHSPLGIKLSPDEIQQRFTLKLTREPLSISDQICFLGEIPRANDFEAKSTAFVFQDGTEDFIMDDSGLFVRTDQGLVVISGCAHSGICNMVDYALQVSGETRIAAVVGGFHLKQNDDVTRKTIAHLKSKGVKQLIPSHCTALPALAAFYTEFPFVQMKAGNVLRF